MNFLDIIFRSCFANLMVVNLINVVFVEFIDEGENEKLLKEFKTNFLLAFLFQPCVFVK